MSLSLEEMIEQIRKNNQEKLMSLSPAEREKYLKEIAELEQGFDDFWSKKYPRYSLSKKKQYWLEGTHRGMRSQGEAFADEYSQFSKKWYDHAKKVEPRFDEIFQYVANNLGFEFDWKEYDKRIKK